MKDKILMFVIGFLAGAVVASGAFFAYTAINGNSTNTNNNGQMTMGEPPEKPSGSNENGAPPEKPGENSSESNDSSSSSKSSSKSKKTTTSVSE